MRKLTDSFMSDLKISSGVLYPITERIQRDDTLLLSIRKNYINIYYRGGSLLKISEQTPGSYKAFFDINYNKKDLPISLPSSEVKDSQVSGEWAKLFSTIKEVMDAYFVNQRKPEREFQQVVSRENNRSSISNETEYFITDIEFAAAGFGARFDMLGVQILSTDRKKAKDCKPVFFEMKYGIKSLKGSAGMLKHIEDITRFISDKQKMASITQMIDSQFFQLHSLGLIEFKKSGLISELNINLEAKPEVVFILANCNPRSKNLKDILFDQSLIDASNTGFFDLKFFVSGYSGYALHSGCMFNLSDFKKIISLYS